MSVGTGGDPQTIDARLIDAAERGDLSEVQKLLAVGSSVRYTDDRGRTALIAAAYANQVDVAKVLIKAGADVNVQDASQQSAYLISTSEGFVELLTLTLANGADVKSLDSFNGTGLIRAAHRGHSDIVRQLLRTNIDVNHVNRLGWTALLEAILLGDGSAKYIDVVTQLVAAKADVNLADSTGVTPLQHARRLNQTEIATILERSNGALSVGPVVRPTRRHPRRDALGHHDDGEVGIRPHARGHDRRVDHSQAVDPVDAPVRIDHRPFVVVGPHRCGAGRVKRRGDLVADERFERVVVVERGVIDEQAFHQRCEWFGAAEVATDAPRFDACERCRRGSSR